MLASLQDGDGEEAHPEDYRLEPMVAEDYGVEPMVAEDYRVEPLVPEDCTVEPSVTETNVNAVDDQQQQDPGPNDHSILDNESKCFVIKNNKL